MIGRIISIIGNRPKYVIILIPNLSEILLCTNAIAPITTATLPTIERGPAKDKSFDVIKLKSFNSVHKRQRH